MKHLNFYMVSAMLLELSLACTAHLAGRASHTERSDNCPGAYHPPDDVKAITNVRVFSEEGFGEPQTVILEDGHIAAVGVEAPEHATIVDGTGKFLIPGFIDGHVHPPDCAGLSELAGRPSGYVLWRPVKPDTNLETLVEESFANKSDFFKIVAEANGVSQAQQNEIVRLVREAGKFTTTHAVEVEFYDQAIASASESIQHTPVDALLSDSQISQLLSQDQFVGPTLEFYRIIFSNPLLPRLLGYGGFSYETVETNVRNMHDAGVPIVTGTDAVGSLLGIINFSFGETLHCQLQNLVNAGFSEIEAILAATAEPARLYRVNDRGSIAEGKRADLVLLNSNPVDNIQNSFDIKAAWIGGIEVADITEVKGQEC